MTKDCVYDKTQETAGGGGNVLNQKWNPDPHQCHHDHNNYLSRSFYA